nr:ubiquitin E3 ligase ICP0 [Phocid alphaherpesvirus 1]
MTVTVSCLHKFCCACLSEWTKINNTCPLCKSIINSMLHSIINDSEFEEVKITPSLEDINLDDLSMEDAQRFFNSDLEGVVMDDDDDFGPVWGEDYDEDYSETSLSESESDSESGHPNTSATRTTVRLMHNRLMRFYTNEITASIVCDIIMEFIDDNGVDCNELTDFLEPMLQGFTPGFVNLLSRHFDNQSRNRFSLATGVIFEEPTPPSSEESDLDSSSSVATEDLTIPDDTQNEDSDSDETQITDGNTGENEDIRTRLRSFTRNPSESPPIIQQNATPETEIVRNNVIDIIDLTLDSDDEIVPSSGNEVASRSINSDVIIIESDSENFTETGNVSNNSLSSVHRNRKRRLDTNIID